MSESKKEPSGQVRRISCEGESTKDVVAMLHEALTDLESGKLQGCTKAVLVVIKEDDGQFWNWIRTSGMDKTETVSMLEVTKLDVYHDM